MGMGSPTTQSTGRNSASFRLMYMGISGTPLRRAIMAAPASCSSIRPLWYRVPSGKMPSTSPLRRARMLVRMASMSLLWRLTKMVWMLSRNRLNSPLPLSSFLAMKAIS